jgi:hypothetical protein
MNLRFALLTILVGCGATAHNASGPGTPVGIHWDAEDFTCTTDECGGNKAAITLAVTQHGKTERIELGQLSADSDGGDVGAKNCRPALTSISCSGTPEQNEFSLEVHGAELVVLRRDWVDTDENSKPPEGDPVKKIALEGKAPFQLVEQK